ncbi:hypothetical protein C2S53_004833 [Perilla frutescens var. hirtella]|uniref:U3 small nucleolar RNA-associated protein 14 n=1 Tax=Perilla frutescens var. hirtella TaxID=608512 RepID=A0AAD4JHU6_PERFH|nr:hypothetical protein C2S53_004833 [Perilla frutescens var. hirtella]
MAEKGKGKSRSEIAQRRRRDGEVKGKKRKSSSSNGKNKEEKRRRGPHLPNALKKELELRNPTVDGEGSDGDEEIDSDCAVGNDFYEYEEGVAEEESTKNKRYDTVEKYEYELPEDFKKKDFIVSEAYPESEYNPSGDILHGGGRISIADLLDPLHGKAGFSKLRKTLNRMEKKTIPTLAPLPKTDKERVERRAAYEQSKKDITRWEPLVKRNREAPTLYFDEDVNLGFSTIGSIASEFKPRTDFEKRMDSLVNQSEVVEAHKNDGARLLELNETSMEDVRERQEKLAKMRSVLFRHELKLKRIKKIKSKTYHRLLKKSKIKAAESSFHMDPEAAKEHAMKLEFKRAEERMTLKHRNSSQWAKRILQRGLQVQDEATRAAFSEQLNKHATLTRKQNSIKEGSSSDDNSDSDDSDDMSAGSDEDVAETMKKKAKEKMLQVLNEGDGEVPTSGVLALPFMARVLKKKKDAADEEAKLALEEDDLGDKSKSGSCDKDAPSGRRVFGDSKKVVNETRKKDKLDNCYTNNSDSESDVEANADDIAQHDQNGKSLEEPDIDHNKLREEFGFGHDSVFKIRQSSDAVKGSEDNHNVRKPEFKVQTELDQESEDNDEDSDTDSEEEMVDGMLSSGPKSTYELPSQAELIQRAFAGDDVEEDFVKEKEAVLDEENPEPEKPVLIPGWGQWTDVQKKRGLPSWMLEEHETAKRKRLESLKKRKDAHLNNVIISQKLDKKAEKLHTKTLPYPYTSKEVFEQSIRMPIGPEFNPVTTIGALNRPEVVKKAGVIIKPIQYEDVSVHERGETRNHNGQKQGKGKDRSRSRKKIAANV